MIGICDDEEKSREMIKEYCQQMEQDLEETFEYKMFASGEEVLEYKADIHILLLDIEMGGMNGIDAMKKLEDADNIKNILFVSGYPDMVFEAFGEKTRGFVCKPVEYKRFSREITKIIEKEFEDNSDRYIEIVANNSHVTIDAEHIMYISGQGRYATIVMDDIEYLVCENLKYWEERLEQFNIKRVHKSYLVNYKYVSELKGTGVKMKNTEMEIPVGRKYYDISKKEYKEYLFEQYRRK